MRTNTKMVKRFIELCCQMYIYCIYFALYYYLNALKNAQMHAIILKRVNKYIGNCFKNISNCSIGAK